MAIIIHLAVVKSMIKILATMLIVATNAAQRIGQQMAVESTINKYIMKNIALAFTLVFLIASCGSQDVSNQSSKTKITTAETIVSKTPIPIDTTKYIYAKVQGMDGKYYFIDEYGEETLGGFEEASDFKDGIACVKIKTKYGFIDGSGTMIIPAEYSSLGTFSDGVCKATLNGKSGYIDIAGNWVLDAKYDWTGDYSEGLAPMQKCNGIGGLGEKINCLYGFMDKTGKIVIEPQFGQYWSGYHEGLAVVTPKGKKTRAYIDTKGNIVFDLINHTYSIRIAGDFKDGVAEVKSGLESIYVNKQGDSIPNYKPQVTETVKLPLTPEREEPEQYYDRDGILTADQAKWGFKNGKDWAIEPKYKVAWSYQSTY